MMKRNSNRSQNFLVTGIKAVRQLGIKPLFLAFSYQFGLFSGLFRFLTKKNVKWQGKVLSFTNHLPSPSDLQNILGTSSEILLEEARALHDGEYRLFGGDRTPLQLGVPYPPLHWTTFENGKFQLNHTDIKTIWEPARLGWAFLLARAYSLSGNEIWSTTFWNYFEIFLKENPPYLGPNWISGQEVALRIIVMAFCAQVFRDSPASSGERLARLAQSLSDHAIRIPATVVYAKAQNNNHLISEAVGLLTAGVLLAKHPNAKNWKTLGWRWLNQALDSQISPDGTYCQHSMNYHRLMLHLAMWGKNMSAMSGWQYPKNVRDKLAAATRWLITQIDRSSGMAANLGPDDGANILPLSQSSQQDYRPVAQAAARTFLGGPVFPEGCWDEASLWLGHEINPQNTLRLPSFQSSILRLLDSSGWASLRAVQYKNRPGHADQLHVEIWQNGRPLLSDPGTYSYNAAQPWENAMSSTAVHNTLMVDDKEQMTRAGKFLWLDWAQAEIIQHTDQMIQARHNGYSKLGIIHTRKLAHVGSGEWRIDDEVTTTKKNPKIHNIKLHWLLPDGKCETSEEGLEIQTESALIRLIFQIHPMVFDTPFFLYRAGKPLSENSSLHPTLGWRSPTYLQRIAALSCVVNIDSHLPLSISTKIEIVSLK